MPISILMSLYWKESPAFLNDCLESIFNQTLAADEVIIVLDGPISVELHDVVNHWKNCLPIKTLPLEFNQGLGRALNYGLAHCKNELIARMDTDDICSHNRLEIQINEFLNNDNLAICGSSILEIDPITEMIISRRTVKLSHDEIVHDLLWRNPFNHMTVMFKKSAVLSVGGYKDLPWMEDWFLWLRLFANGFSGMNVNQDLVHARTGVGMIERRSGFGYIKSEWLMTKYKINSQLFSIPNCLVSFLWRAIPRLLPIFILSKLYKLSRS